MKLKRLYVESFGTLQNYRLELQENLHVLHAENGWGKSTLAVFIKAMLYGLPATKKRSLDDNERQKYNPWQGGAYGGSLEFETARGAFRIERYFGAKESADTCTLYDLATNRPTDVYPEPIGESLFGIDAEGFERTVYLSQRAVARGENNSITAKLGSLLDDVDDIGSYEDAMAALEKCRKYYILTGNRGRIAELESERAKCDAELEALERVRAQIDLEEKEFLTREEELKALRAELAEVRAEVQRAGLRRERAAHLEAKTRLEREVHELEHMRDCVEAQLCGHHPSDEELEKHQALLTRMQTATARLQAIPTEDEEVGRTECLPEAFFGQCPGEELLSKMAKANARLQELHRMRLRDEERADAALLRRFPSGAPEEEKIRAAYTACEMAQKRLQACTEAEKQPLPRASALPWILGALGALLLAACTIPVFGALVYLFLGAGVDLVIAAPIVGLFGRAKRQRVLSERRQASADAKRKYDETAAAVERFLASYGVKEADLARALSELSFAARQYREALARCKQRRGDMEGLQAEIDRILAFLRPSFALFGLQLGDREDYRDEIEALRRDIVRVNGVRARNEKRRGELAAARNELAACREEWAPFAKRFDIGGTRSPSECWRVVRERETEYRRLVGEIEKKKDALAAFLKNKRLENDPSGETVVSYEALVDRERALQTEAEALQDTQNRARHHMETLSLDADRMSDVGALKQRLSEELAAARENSNTVAQAMLFLEEAKTALSTRYLGDMQKSFTRFLAALTEDTPPESVMDPSFEVSLRAGGKTHAIESFSRGWRDAVQFCVRLSLTDALYAEGEKPFLLLDDPFVNLDDTRLRAARHLLEMLSREYQIVYMVCHADRM